MPFSSLINLSSLNGTNGFRLDGVAGDDKSGYSVASAGDVNGDGFADLIVGAQWADPNGNSNSGSSYVVFGKASGFGSSINLSTLNGSTGFRLDGVSAYEYSGNVASAGDVNGDGFADLIVGSGSVIPNGNTNPRSSYVVFGKASGFASSIKLSSLDGTTGFKLADVAASADSSYSVASAGDLNGDGYADLIIGASGADPNDRSNSGSSYVVFGKSSGWGSGAVNLSDLDGIAGFRLDGVAANDVSGCSVASAGDVNGDGYADIIVGAPYANRYGGYSYVVFGQASGFASSINLSSLNGITGFRLDGVQMLGGFTSGDVSGYSAASAGDVNGDGFSDLIVGAPGATPPSSSFGINYNSGTSYVFFGKATGFASSTELSTLDGTTGFRIDGLSTYCGCGDSVASAGDVDGDGFADLLIGVAQADATYAGACYVVFGRASGFTASLNLSTLNGTNGFKLAGVAAGDRSGESVASAGDVNGDGRIDLIIGAHDADPHGYSSGSTYVYFSPATGGALYRGTTLADTIRGTPDADTINGYGQNDKLYGNAGDDIINGGAGNDSIDGGTGTDLALLSGPQSAYRIGIRDNLVITSGPDGQDQYVNIEAFQWGSTAAISLATLQASSATTGLLYAALAGKPAAFFLPDLYTGPVPGLTNQLLATATNDVISGTTGNDFINALAGDDAVDGGAGNDVIDGGLGSNFLTGNAGRDIFFLDGRGAATAYSWATITDFSPGEQVTIWGYKPGISRFLWVASDGAVGFKGATLHADLDGNGQTDTSLTFSGLTQEQLPTQSFGTVGGYDYVFFG